MTPFSRSNACFWIHTCPQRVGRLQALRESIEASDLGSAIEIVCPAKGTLEIERWNRAKLLELSGKFEWIVRIEDDVVINKHIVHNLETWAALYTGEDFGVALLHLNKFYWQDTNVVSRMRRDRRSGSLWLDQRLVCGAQGQVFNSDVFSKEIYPRLPLMTGAEMDTGMTGAVYDAGLRTYISYPDMVEQSDIAADSAIGHTASDAKYGSDNFSLDYRSEESPSFDRRPVDRFGKFYSAYFVNAKKEVVAVDVPIVADVIPAGVIWARHRGAPIMVKSKNLFWSLKEAKQFAGRADFVLR